MFSMNDIGGTGFLSKDEFARMLRFDWFLFFTASFFSAWWFVFNPVYVLQVFHWDLQRCSVKEPGRGRHQGHDAGRGLWQQGENHMGGLSFPPAGPRQGAAVCSTQCQRLEKVLSEKILFLNSHRPHSDESVRRLCVCARRDGETGEEAAESRPESVLHLSRKQVRERDMQAGIAGKQLWLSTDKNDDPLQLFHLFLSPVIVSQLTILFIFCLQHQDGWRRATQTEKVC